MKKVFIIADEHNKERKRLLAQFLGDYEILATSTEKKAQAAILINPSLDIISGAKAAYPTVLVVSSDSDSLEFRQRCMESGAAAVITSDMGIVGWARKIVKILGE